MSCCQVKMIVVPECTDTFIMPTGLSAGSYTVRITDKFGKVFNKDFIIDESGDLTIDLSLYPNGLFTQYSGTVTLEVFDGCESKTLNVCDTEYGYVSLSFNEVDNTDVSAYTDTQTFTVCCI